MGATTTTTRLRCLFLLFLVQLLLLLSAAAGARWQDFLRLPSESEGDAAAGTRWAVLIAGSNGYYNYRHQASGRVPRIPDHEEGRAQGREHRRLHVRRHRQQPRQPAAGRHHQPPYRRRRVRRCAQGLHGQGRHRRQLPRRPAREQVRRHRRQRQGRRQRARRPRLRLLQRPRRAGRPRHALRRLPVRQGPGAGPGAEARRRRVQEPGVLPGGVRVREHLRGPPAGGHPRVRHHGGQRRGEQLGHLLPRRRPGPAARVRHLPRGPLQRRLDGGQRRAQPAHRVAEAAVRGGQGPDVGARYLQPRLPCHAVRRPEPRRPEPVPVHRHRPGQRQRHVRPGQLAAPPLLRHRQPARRRPRLLLAEVQEGGGGDAGEGGGPEAAAAGDVPAVPRRQQHGADRQPPLRRRRRLQGPRRRPAGGAAAGRRLGLPQGHGARVRGAVRPAQAVRDEAHALLRQHLQRRRRRGCHGQGGVAGVRRRPLTTCLV